MITPQAHEIANSNNVKYPLMDHPYFSDLSKSAA